MPGYFSHVVEAISNHRYLVGVDLGQSRDPSAVIVMKRTAGTVDYNFSIGQRLREHDFETGAVYDVGHIERLPLSTRYPAVVEHTRALIHSIRGSERPTPDVHLVVDRTGVGRAVGDLMQEADKDLNPVLVTITAGDAVTRADDGGYGVPKKELASVVQRLLQTGRLRIAEGQPFEAELKEELAGFRAKIKLSGHVSFAAGEDWRSAPHDDLVLALALAAWAGEKGLASESWGFMTNQDLHDFFRQAGVGTWQ